LAGWQAVGEDHHASRFSSDHFIDKGKCVMFQTPNRIRHRAVGICAGLSLAMLLTGCAGMSENETAGTIVGGAAGAVIGSQFGKGDGRIAATAIGAILGATVGREIGASLDETSRRRAGEATHRALETADVGTGITWDNPANAGAPARGSTVITRQGADQQGRTCREFQQTVTIGGEEVQSYGTACRDDNGDWQLVSS
jgi:surface antigen